MGDLTIVWRQAAPYAENILAFFYPGASCPTDPNDVNFSASVTNKPLSEVVQAEFTPGTVQITVKRDLESLLRVGSGSLCAFDNNCGGSAGARCVVALGRSKWAGPTLQTPLQVVCSELEAGRCKVVVPGFSMDTLDFTTNRLAVAETCGVRMYSKV